VERDIFERITMERKKGRRNKEKSQADDIPSHLREFISSIGHINLLILAVV
jgi:hypothetical protein